MSNKILFLTVFVLSSFLFLVSGMVEDVARPKLSRTRNAEDYEEENYPEYLMKHMEHQPEEIPMTFDWRSWLSYWPVQDGTKKCHSGWAFAALDAIEAQYALKDGQRSPMELSKQEMIDCAHHGADGSKVADGCEAGTTEEVATYVKEKGAMEGRYYPYKGKYSNQCKRDEMLRRTNSLTHKIDGWGYLEEHMDDMHIMLALLFYGPLNIVINANHSAFQDYKGGILIMPNEYDHSLDTVYNHAVVLVGFDNAFHAEKDANVHYWIVRNSWGEDWGEGGYARIAMGHGYSSSLCFNCKPSIPIIHAAQQKVPTGFYDYYVTYVRHRFEPVHQEKKQG